ncbi:tryptase gamma [Fundulus heteroclitus]|uniref:tryptase gamma n=1 Tax=Fundulus heteroclitus TaxID=8078 RepID=UPI00165AD721|nr:tryptase gamma [Fundulus heteroclitus]
MASLQKNGLHVCGGTLVSETYVLTDARCFSGSINLLDWTVRLGRLTQNGANPSEMLFNVVNIHMSSLTGNNIALLKLSPPPTINDYIQPICLGNRRTFPAGSECWAVGWSSGRGGEEQALQQIQTIVQDCGDASTADIMCTLLFTKEQGDYGGPLMCKDNGTWFQTVVLPFVNTISPAAPMMTFEKLDRFQSFLEDMSLVNSSSISLSPVLLLGHLLLFALCIQAFTQETFMLSGLQDVEQAEKNK